MTNTPSTYDGPERQSYFCEVGTMDDVHEVQAERRLYPPTPFTEDDWGSIIYDKPRKDRRVANRRCGISWARRDS